jgi:hypothetical protein
MSKQDDYLDNAAQTLNLASHVSKLAQRCQVLDLAEKWVELADRSCRLKSRGRPVSPADALQADPRNARPGAISRP